MSEPGFAFGVEDSLERSAANPNVWRQTILVGRLAGIRSACVNKAYRGAVPDGRRVRPNSAESSEAKACKEKVEVRFHRSFNFVCDCINAPGPFRPCSHDLCCLLRAM